MISEEFGKVTVTAKRNRHVAEVWNGGTRLQAVADANAAFIVDACNNHERLTLALDRIVALLDATEWNADTVDEIARAVREAGYTIHEP